MPKNPESPDLVWQFFRRRWGLVWVHVVTDEFFVRPTPHLVSWVDRYSAFGYQTHIPWAPITGPHGA